MTMTDAAFDPAKVEAFVGHLMPILKGGLLSHMIDIGDRTGLFAAAAQGPGSSQEIADRAGLQERYVREWLGAVVTGGIVDYDPETHTYLLPPEHAVMLMGPSSMAPLAAANRVLAKHIPELARVFREGGGISYDEYAPDFTDAMDAMGRGAFDQFLVDAYVPLAAGLTEKLAAGANVADLACGAGHALVLLAQAFPASTFTGLDLDRHAIDRARAEAGEAGLTNIAFVLADIATLEVDTPFDVVFVFDALHDQVDPAGVLRHIHDALAPDGVFFLREPHAADTLEGNLGNPMAAVQYSVSTLHCLTVSLAHGGAGIGTVFGEQLARTLLADAGFEEPTVHPAPGQPFDVVYVTRPRPGS
jgi:SAM-dependent methyltransferase